MPEQSSMSVLLKVKVRRRINVKAWLNKHESGQWEYDRKAARWYCDDGRWVARVYRLGYGLYMLYDIDGHGKPIFPMLETKIG